MIGHILVKKPSPTLTDTLAPLPLPLRLFAHTVIWFTQRTPRPLLRRLPLLLASMQGRDYGRAVRLESLVWRAYHQGDDTGAVALAHEWLTLAAQFPDDGAVFGVATHDAHQVLGLICLRNGKTDAAIAHLLAAGRTTGSPTLNAYGPPLLLARALVEAGEKDTVLEYLDLFARFWVAKDAPFQALEQERTFLLQKWKAVIRKGRVPHHRLWIDIVPYSRYSKRQ